MKETKENLVILVEELIEKHTELIGNVQGVISEKRDSPAALVSDLRNLFSRHHYLFFVIFLSNVPVDHQLHLFTIYARFLVRLARSGLKKLCCPRINYSTYFKCLLINFVIKFNTIFTCTAC